MQTTIKAKFNFDNARLRKNIIKSSQACCQTILKNQQFQMQKVVICLSLKQDCFKYGQSHTFYKTKKDYFALQKILFFFWIQTINKQKSLLTKYQQSLKDKLMSILQQKKIQTINQKSEAKGNRLNQIIKIQQYLKNNLNIKTTFFQSSFILQFLVNVLYKQQLLSIQNRLTHLIHYFSIIFCQQINIHYQYPNFYQQLKNLSSFTDFSNTKQMQTKIQNIHSTEVIYKLTRIKIGQTQKIEIKQTNQENFIYFNFIKNEKCKKINELFKDNKRQEVLQSQNSSSECDSEVVQDQDYLKLSQRLSNTGRKNSSFNSGQFLEENQNQNLLFSKINANESTNAQMSENKFASYHNMKDNLFAYPENYQQFTNFKTLYTSIDLMTNSNINNSKYAQKHRDNIYSKQIDSQLDLRPKIKVNLFNQQQKIILTKNLFADLVFQSDLYKEKTNQVIKNKKNLIRKFFKKGSHQFSLQKNQKHRKFSEDSQISETLYFSMREAQFNSKNKPKSLEKMAKSIKIENQSYFE